MAFTTESEITLVNQVFDRLSAGQITLVDQTSVEAKVAFRHWSTTLNSLTRSFLWPFLIERQALVQIETLTLDAAPTPAAFSVGATLTGGTSGTTATVLEVTSDTVYVVAFTSGDWTDGEIISDGTNSRDCAAGYPTTAVTTPLYQWTFQYELPTDLSRIVNIYEDDGSDYEWDRWTREGTRVLTNYSTVNMKYVKTVTDPDDFDPMFSELLILRLAWKLMPSLAGTMSRSSRDELWRELQLMQGKAASVCYQENNQTGRKDWNLARYTGGLPNVFES